MIKKILFLLSILLIVSCHRNSSQQIQPIYSSIIIDSLIKKSKNASFTDSLRNNYLKSAYSNLNNIKNDSLKIKPLIKISRSYLGLGNFDKYKSISSEVLLLSTLKRDTLNMARSQYALAYYYDEINKKDSAYYYYFLSQKSYSFLKKDAYSGTALLNMAIIQEFIKDYTGSEINSIKSIKKFKKGKYYSNLYYAYNNLGVIYSKLGQYDLAIENYEKSYEYSKKYNNDIYLEATYSNNVGRIYEKRFNYLEAIKYYKKGLGLKGLFNKHPYKYAMLLNNLAYSKYKLNQKEQIPKLFYDALKIRDSLNFKDGQASSNQSLAEYYLSVNDTIKSLYHGLISMKIAKKNNYNEGLLKSYYLLSEIKPGKEGRTYLRKYINLTDSLHQQERVIREKFTRIAYQTDEIIQEKEIEVKKNELLSISLIIGSSFSILIFIYLKLRSKNTKLEFNQKQDKANLEIYNLMLSQQKMFRKGSSKEKNRISQELHDGVLGRLFGTRLSLDILNEGKSEDDILEREKNIEELQSIEEDIRKIAHNLNTSLFDNDTSFKILIEQLIAKQSKITKFEYDIKFNKHLNWENISNTIKINCYRIIQESIQNINKYAHAKTVNLSFTKNNDCLLIHIEDDGVGFNLKKTKKGIGIRNIRSRVKDLKGKVEFISNFGTGTKIQIEIPILDEGES